jgi:hypothetical protein
MEASTGALSLAEHRDSGTAFEMTSAGLDVISDVIINCQIN